jgi:hypothetical protein
MTRASVALAILIAFGCALFSAQRTADRRRYLDEAGFQKIVATTDAQRADLARLPAHKVAPVAGEVRRYVWADPQDGGYLYVGMESDYDEYIHLVARELIDNDYLATDTPGPQVSKLEQERYEMLAEQSEADPHEVSIDWSLWPDVQ